MLHVLLFQNLCLHLVYSSQKKNQPLFSKSRQSEELPILPLPRHHNTLSDIRLNGHVRYLPCTSKNSNPYSLYNPPVKKVNSILSISYFLPRCGFGFFSKSDFCAIFFSHFFSSSDSFFKFSLSRLQILVWIVPCYHLLVCSINGKLLICPNNLKT